MSGNLSLPLALLLAVPTVACLERPDDAEEVSSNLERTHGGLDTSDEAPAFAAEAELRAAAIERDTAAIDALAGAPEIEATVAAGFRMMIVWGKLPADPTAEQARDWSGELTLSRGALVVRRTIGFEDRSDQLLPRTTRSTVSFHSVTRLFVDGLALTVFDPDAGTAPDGEPQTLTYTSADGGAAFTLDLSQLAAGPIVVDAGDGFQIVAVGQRRRDDACDRGFMRGRWQALTPQLGRFLGVVTDEHGIPVGHVRGEFGRRRDGEQVLFGKFINREGQFRGLLAGSFGDGEYQARWIDRQGDRGTAHGAYMAGSTASAGHFLGRWAEARCADDVAGD